jgi:hypothetical protein
MDNLDPKLEAANFPSFNVAFAALSCGCHTSNHHPPSFALGPVSPNEAPSSHDVLIM